MWNQDEKLNAVQDVELALGDIGRIARDLGFEEDPAVAKIDKQGTKLLTDMKQTSVEEVG
jgi:hypothetical protein